MAISSHNKRLLAILIILLSYHTNAQEDNRILNKVDSLFSKGNFKEVIKNKSQKIDITNKKVKAKFDLLIAKSYANLNIEDSSLIYYQKSLKQFKINNDFESIAKTNLEIYLILDSQNNLNINLLV